MRMLFIGGTGNISGACTRAALEAGHDVTHLNRGRSGRSAPDGVHTITADARRPDDVAQLLRDTDWDVVVDWIAFLPEHVEADVRLYRDLTRQYILISTAAVYDRPPRHQVITENTPATNAGWDYARDKIACEEVARRALRDFGFPATIVRPSQTYSDGWFPTLFGRDFTLPQRIIDRRPVVVAGDGSTYWTLTHAEDFAIGFTGLLGNDRAIGETFHITGDESLTWAEIYRTIGTALGVEPHIVGVPSEVIARFDPGAGPRLETDMARNTTFDNSRIKSLVSGFYQRIPLSEGMARSVEWITEHPGDRKTNPDTDRLLDSMIEAIDRVGPAASRNEYTRNE